VLAVALLLAGAAPAAAAPFRATLRAPDHTPHAGAKDWKITVTARSNAGAPLQATASYAFLLAGKVVSRQYPNPGSTKAGSKPYAFRGSFSDAILWPSAAAHAKLTFRVVVTVAGKGTVNLDWPVVVQS
jgi:hypothetical protein